MNSRFYSDSFNNCYKKIPLVLELFIQNWDRLKCKKKYQFLYSLNNFAIWKAYLTLEIVKQEKCQKDNGSSILLCPTHYCVQQFTVKQNTVSTRRAPDKLRICAMKTSKNACIIKSEFTHYTYIMLCKQTFQIRSVLVQSCT